MSLPVSGCARASYRQLAICAAFLLFLAILRAPQIIWVGRVYAEDGVWLQLAQRWSPLDIITYILPNIGYLVLQLNLFGYIAAKLIPLDVVPAFYAMVFLIMLLVPLLVAFSDSVMGRVIPLGLITAALLFAGNSADPWLNIACSQFVLAIGTAVILAAEQMETAWGRIAARLFLGFASLSGMASAILFPGFLLRAILDGNRNRWIHAAIVFSGLSIQLGLIAYHKMPNRPQIAVKTALATAEIKQIDNALLGAQGLPPNGPAFSRPARIRLALSGEIKPVAMAILCILLASFYLALFSLARAARSMRAFYLICCAIILGVVGARWPIGLSNMESVSPHLNGRYWYPVGALILIAIIVCIYIPCLPKINRLIATVFLTWMLLIGAIDFTRPQAYYFDSPASWYSEIATWRQHPDHMIRNTGWGIHLPPPR